jgi:alpha-D-ribose 1-methylphosphonate 5-triphosphate synthase subunit PhnH
MSPLASVKPYDEVFDSQKHYRTLLDCTARPGSIGQLDDVLLDVPSFYNRATALTILTLFGGDTTYALVQSEAQAANSPIAPDCGFIRRETGAKAAPVHQADFLVLFDAAVLPQLKNVRIGSLSYPDLGATAIVQVEGISPAPMQGSLRLRLTGPGIETETIVFVSGAAVEFFVAHAHLNQEFPMGLDLFLTCDSLSAGPCVLGLPRTTRVDWERI